MPEQGRNSEFHPYFISESWGSQKLIGLGKNAMSTDKYASVKLQTPGKGDLNGAQPFLVYLFLVLCDGLNPTSQLFQEGQ